MKDQYTGNKAPLYIGTKYSDGTVRIDGPLSGDNAFKRIRGVTANEGLPVTTTRAANIGVAILDILGSIIRQEKTDKSHH